MSKAESNKRWAQEHKGEIAEYNQAYYAAKAQDLREARKKKYDTDPEYRAKAIERARQRRAALKVKLAKVEKTIKKSKKTTKKK